MKAGDTFWLRDRRIEGGHPHFVLSDPSKDADRVVFASLTEFHPNKDQSCVLRKGADTMITKHSVVSYRDAGIAKNSFLDEQLAAGELISGPPLSPAILDQIRAGCAMTRQIPNEALDILEEQGLIPVL